MPSVVILAAIPLLAVVRVDRLLGPLGIGPDRHETLSGRVRGYRRDAFRDAMARYLPS